jgi:ABC-type bacteriocin/lantibiotic exporter with double-glycine peptidase domain
MGKATESPWKRLGELLKLDKREVSQLYIYAIFSGIVSLSLPLGIQSVIHFIQGGEITTSWVILVILVICGVILTGVLQIMQLRITENIQQRIFTRYSFNFAYRFPRLDREYLKGKIPTEMMNRFFDVITLQKGVSKVLLEFSTAFLQIFFSLLVLAFYHPFYIAFGVSLVIIVLVVFKPIIKRGFQTSLNESKYKYKIAYWLQEIAKTNWSFRLTPNSPHALNRIDHDVQEYIASRESHFKILWKQFIWMIALKSVIVASLLGLGGYLVIDQQMNLGQFVAAEVLIILILSAIEKIIQTLETLYDVFTALEKLGQITDIPITFEESEKGPDADSLFPIEMVSTAEANIRPIFAINEHESVFINGGHQQEIVKLFQELIDPSISLKTKPRWNKIIPDSERLAANLQQFSWFSHNTQLFDGTVIDNILMSREELTIKDLEKAIETMNIGYFVNQKAEGYNFYLSKANKVISEAEREKILIAKAIVSSPALLLISFHGSTFNAAEQTEIIQSIQANYKNTTILCASNEKILANWKTVQFDEIKF